MYLSDGFRKGRPCVINLLSFFTRVTDAVQEIDGWVNILYLDKVFDKLPHRIRHRRLLWKLEHICGLRGITLKWMKNSLQERNMRTIIRDIGSSWGEVLSGVPQGSVLAPKVGGHYVRI